MDLNHRPELYESPALPTELRRQKRKNIPSFFLLGGVTAPIQLGRYIKEGSGMSGALRAHASSDPASTTAFFKTFFAFGNGKGPSLRYGAPMRRAVTLAQRSFGYSLRSHPQDQSRLWRDWCRGSELN